MELGEWVDVKGFENYQVNRDGLVKSKQRVTIDAHGNRHVTRERIRKFSVHGQGYLQVSMYLNGKPYTRKVHVLVADAFLGERNGKTEVNHKNGIKSDNSLGNLEFVTPSENVQHAYDTGLNAGTRGTDHGMSVLDDDKVRNIIELSGTLSIKTIAELMDVSYDAIYDVMTGLTWTHVTGIKSYSANKYTKLKAADIPVIIEFGKTMKQSEIAARYNTDVTTICNIFTGKSWSKITGRIHNPIPRSRKTSPIDATRNELNQHRLHCHGLSPLGI